MACQRASCAASAARSASGGSAASTAYAPSMRWIASVTAPVVASISPSRAMTRAAAWLIRALSKSAMAGGEVRRRLVLRWPRSQAIAPACSWRRACSARRIDQRDRLLVVVLRLRGGGEAGGVLGRVHEHAGRAVANGAGVRVIRGEPVCLEEV